MTNTQKNARLKKAMQNDANQIVLNATTGRPHEGPINCGGLVAERALSIAKGLRKLPSGTKIA